MDEKHLETLLDLALAEDVGSGDITTAALLDPAISGQAVLVARGKLVVCGQDIVRRVFLRVDPELRYEQVAADGRHRDKGDEIGVVSGSLASILTAERTALNFLQRLSGVATQASLFATMVDHKVRILDTRKTTPGWRELEKYAVHCGGGNNHRHGLYDAYLIKNNHVDALGGDLVEAVRRCFAVRKEGELVEVEVRNRSELEQAVDALPDVILLDNMTAEETKQAVDFVRQKPLEKYIQLEASGGIDESNIQNYAKTGVDSISVGALTHSAKAADISLRYQSREG